MSTPTKASGERRPRGGSGRARSAAGGRGPAARRKRTALSSGRASGLVAMALAPRGSGRDGRRVEDLAHDVLLRDPGVAGLRLEARGGGRGRAPPRPSRPRAPRSPGPRGGRGPARRGRASGSRAASSRASPRGGAAWPRRARPRSGRASARPSPRASRAWSATTSSAASTGSTDSSGWRSAWLKSTSSLVLGRGVAEADPQAEAVELRLGQRVGPVELDRVLGGEHEEGRGQRPGRARRSRPAPRSSPRAAPTACAARRG